MPDDVNLSLHTAIRELQKLDTISVRDHKRLMALLPDALPDNVRLHPALTFDDCEFVIRMYRQHCAPVTRAMTRAAADESIRQAGDVPGGHDGNTP